MARCCCDASASEYGAIAVVGCRRRGISLRNTDKLNASDIITNLVPQFNEKAGAELQKSRFKEIIQIYRYSFLNFVSPEVCWC